MDQEKPQKSKPSTDAKQMDGPAYSARSKTKRPSHSDNDSSRSQSHQPPLKRQTRTRHDAKQAKESVGINNDSAPDDSPIDTNTFDEPTSAEIALRNELVLESLFSYMNRSDLLSCRLVNKQWQYEATKDLRRRKLIIKFTFHCHETPYRKNTVFQDPCRVIREFRTPSLLSSFQIEAGSLNDRGPQGFRSIFTTLGNLMKHLTLYVNCYIYNYSFKSSLMTDLPNLFFRETPNLEFLEIKFQIPEHWKAEMQTFDLSDPPQNDTNEFLLLPNLKTFIATGSPPLKFLKDVINAAVNLKSLGGDVSCQFSALIKHFMGDEGRDRIYLLKYLRISLFIGVRIPWYELDIDLLETFLAKHKKNLKLETFECASLIVGLNFSAAPRIVNAVNQLLECSSESLQKLRIDPMKWFLDLLVIPRLPMLKEIFFNCFWRTYSKSQNEEDFFPRGFNMNYSFPNVSSIFL